VLGIFGYTYGSLLGVFLVRMLTKTRGSETGNLVAMVCGFIAVAVLSGLHNDLWNLLHPSDPDFLAWMWAHPILRCDVTRSGGVRKIKATAVVTKVPAVIRHGKSMVGSQSPMPMLESRALRMILKAEAA
jgi:hypothetical protein